MLPRQAETQREGRGYVASIDLFDRADYRPMHPFELKTIEKQVEKLERHLDPLPK